MIVARLGNGFVVTEVEAYAVFGGKPAVFVTATDRDGTLIIGWMPQEFVTVEAVPS